jgi:hypothetical protein
MLLSKNRNVCPKGLSLIEQGKNKTVRALIFKKSRGVLEDKQLQRLAKTARRYTESRDSISAFVSVLDLQEIADLDFVDYVVVI